jgi:hypothetical protein
MPIRLAHCYGTTIVLSTRLFLNEAAQSLHACASVQIKTRVTQTCWGVCFDFETFCIGWPLPKAAFSSKSTCYRIKGISLAICAIAIRTCHSAVLSDDRRRPDVVSDLIQLGRRWRAAKTGVPPRPPCFGVFGIAGPRLAKRVARKSTT